MRLALLFTILVSATALAADPAPKPAPAPAMDPALQAAMEKMSKTGVEHAALAKAVGEWDVQSTMWMDPIAPPSVSKGSATFTSVLSGKWIRQDYRGEMMGTPYIGIGMSGYDTVENQYVATWHDGMSTMMTTMIGKSSDNGKTITYTSEMAHCPMINGPLKHRYVYSTESNDKIRFTMYETVTGQPEHKGMELLYTRKAAAK